MDVAQSTSEVGHYHVDDERCDGECGLELKVSGKYLIKISKMKLCGALESPAVAHYAISFGELADTSG